MARRYKLALSGRRKVSNEKYVNVNKIDFRNVSVPLQRNEWYSVSLCWLVKGELEP